VYLYSP